MKNNSQIVIYQTKDGQTKLDVQLKEETVWLTQKQIAELFGTQRPAITKHLSNIFKTGELLQDSVGSILEHTATDGKKYKTKFYNLDAIIAVGYRVNSKRATQFRIWANQIIKDYLVNGYALNEKRLAEAKERLEEVNGNYAFALDLLDKYDHQKVADPHSTVKNTYRITAKEALQALQKLKQKTDAGELFARPKDKSFESSLSTIYQTFDGKDRDFRFIDFENIWNNDFIVTNQYWVQGVKQFDTYARRTE